MKETVYIRYGSDDELMWSSDPTTDPPQWSSTGISETTIFDGQTLTTLETWFDRWSHITELEEIEGEFKLETQKRIGRTLHRALGSRSAFGFCNWLHLVALPEEGDDPAILTRNDRFLDLFCRVPWNLITRSDDSVDPVFLARDPSLPASVTIDAARRADGAPYVRDVRLPPFPTVLLVVPTENGLPGKPTHGGEHLETLKKKLLDGYERVGLGRRLIHVRSFTEFSEQSKTQRPHIVYFYGHAEASDDSTRFLFDAEGDDDGWTDVDRIRDALSVARQLGDFSPIVWINACKGASARRNSFLLALSRVASTVLATRTLAAVEDSCTIAEFALPMIVEQGQAPHSALRWALNKTRPPVTSGRWATTVVSVQYDLWSALATEERQVEDADSAGDFPMRMDRIAPLREVEVFLTKRLTDPSRRPTVMMWKGDDDQRLDIFSRRVMDLLLERFPNRSPTVRRVDLQLNDFPKRARDHYLASIFLGLRKQRSVSGSVSVNFAIVGQTIRLILSDENPLLVLEHGPFESVHLELILDYIAFWNELHQSLLANGRSFQVALAFEFNDEAGSLPARRRAGGELLVELGAVSARELTGHLATFHLFYGCSEETAPGKAQELIGKFNGSFRGIHAELESLVNLSRWQQEVRFKEGET